MSFRTNRKTQKVFPISGNTFIPTLDDLVMQMSPRGQREYVRFATDRLNTITPITDWNKRYNGWYNWDTWNTMLILQNDQSTYRWLQSWKANWQKKRRSGRFVRELAEFTVWKYLVPSAQGKAAPVRSPTPDPRIDRSKVNYGEIVDHLLAEIDEELGHGVYGSRVY